MRRSWWSGVVATGTLLAVVAGDRSWAQDKPVDSPPVREKPAEPPRGGPGPRPPRDAGPPGRPEGDPQFRGPGAPGGLPGLPPGVQPPPRGGRPGEGGGGLGGPPPGPPQGPPRGGMPGMMGGFPGGAGGGGFAGGMPRGSGFMDWEQLRRDDPEMYELQRADVDLERQTQELAAELRGGGKDRRDQLKKQISEVVQKHFDVRQKRRQLHLTRIEQDVQRMRDELKRREDSREAIIKRRTAELVGEHDDLDF